MKKTIFYCDRCEKEMSKHHDVYVPYDLSIHGVVSHGFQICEDCAEEYIENSKKFYSERMWYEVKK